MRGLRSQRGTLVADSVVAPCLNGDWEDLARSADYSGFLSEQECRSYAAQGGTLVNPLALCKQQFTDAGLAAAADANYILGTPGDDDFTARMTAGDDVVCGFAGNDRIHTSAANLGSIRLFPGDVFLGADGADFVLAVDGGTFEGDNGNDEVYSMWYEASAPGGGTFNGGQGDDHAVQMYRGTINGGDGNDSVGFLGGGTFNGGDGSDSVEQINGGSFNGFTTGTFNGGAGNDLVKMMYLGMFNGGDGNDQVSECYSGGTTDSVESVATARCLGS